MPPRPMWNPDQHEIKYLGRVQVLTDSPRGRILGHIVIFMSHYAGYAVAPAMPGGGSHRLGTGAATGMDLPVNASIRPDVPRQPS